MSVAACPCLICMFVRDMPVLRAGPNRKLLVPLNTLPLPADETVASSSSQP